MFKDWECKSSIQILRLYLLPHELVSVPDEVLLKHMREVAKRGLGLGRIQILKAAAGRSVGIRSGSELAKTHQTKWIDRMKSLFEDHEYIFLNGNINNFFEELERIHPEIIMYKAI